MILFCSEDTGTINIFKEINSKLKKRISIVKSIDIFKALNKIKISLIITGTAPFDKKVFLYAKKIKSKFFQLLIIIGG